MTNFLTGTDTELYLQRVDVLTVNDNPFILVKRSRNKSMTPSEFYMTNHIVGDYFVFIDLENQKVVGLDSESKSGNTCLECNDQQNTHRVSGFQITDKKINVISDNIDNPTKVKKSHFELCGDCLQNIDTNYKYAIEGDEDDLLSHII